MPTNSDDISRNRDPVWRSMLIDFFFYAIVLYVLITWVLPEVFVEAQAPAIEDGAPRLAHPPNQLHFDRRYGVAVGPNQELFTGDVIVITVEDDNPYDGSPIFNVWSVNEAGQITCIDPTATGSYAAPAQQQYTTDGYGSAYDQPTYGGDYGAAWSPSLAHMFVVNIVDGRLGQFYLSPVVTFPQSPKYITPQPNRPRSGVASTVGSDGWALGEDEVLAINAFTAPGDSMYGYSVGFYYDPTTNQYQYRENLSRKYGNTNPSGYNMYTNTVHDDKFRKMTTQKMENKENGPGTGNSGHFTIYPKKNQEKRMGKITPISPRSFSPFSTPPKGPNGSPESQSDFPKGRPMKTHSYGYTEPSQYGSSSYDDPEGYEDGGRIAIRGSSMHGFCRCDNGFVLCYNIGQPTLMYPDPSNLAPIFSWFKVNKIPSPVVRRLMENYMASVAGGLPRTFLLLSALPFTDRVDTLHFHGAEAMLSSRRVRLGQLRMTTRGTKLEQQTTLVLRNLVSDTIVFTFAIGFFQTAVFGIGDLPLIPIITPFGRDQPKHVMMLNQDNNKEAASSSSKNRGGSGGYTGDGKGVSTYNWMKDRKTYSDALAQLRQTDQNKQNLVGVGKTYKTHSPSNSGNRGHHRPDYISEDAIHLKTTSQSRMSLDSFGNPIPGPLKPSIGQPPMALMMQVVEENEGIEDGDVSDQGNSTGNQLDVDDYELDAAGNRDEHTHGGVDAHRRGYSVMHAGKPIHNSVVYDGAVKSSASGSMRMPRDEMNAGHDSIPRDGLHDETYLDEASYDETQVEGEHGDVDDAAEQGGNANRGYLHKHSSLRPSSDVAATEEAVHAKAVSAELVRVLSVVVRGVAVAAGHPRLCERDELRRSHVQKKGAEKEQQQRAKGEEQQMRMRGCDGKDGCDIRIVNNTLETATFSELHTKSGKSRPEEVQNNLEIPDSFPGACIDAWTLAAFGLEQAVESHDISLSNDLGQASLTYLLVRDPWQARVAVLRSRAQIHTSTPMRARQPHTALEYRLHGLISTIATQAGTSISELSRSHFSQLPDFPQKTEKLGDSSRIPDNIFPKMAKLFRDVDDADRAVLLAGILAVHYNSATHARGASELSELLAAMDRAREEEDALEHARNTHIPTLHTYDLSRNNTQTHHSNPNASNSTNPDTHTNIIITNHDVMVTHTDAETDADVKLELDIEANSYVTAALNTTSIPASPRYSSRSSSLAPALLATSSVTSHNNTTAAYHSLPHPHIHTYTATHAHVPPQTFPDTHTFLSNTSTHPATFESTYTSTHANAHAHLMAFNAMSQPRTCDTTSNQAQAQIQTNLLLSFRRRSHRQENNLFSRKNDNYRVFNTNAHHRSKRKKPSSSPFRTQFMGRRSPTYMQVWGENRVDFGTGATTELQKKWGTTHEEGVGAGEKEEGRSAAEREDDAGRQNSQSKDRAKPNSGGVAEPRGLRGGAGGVDRPRGISPLSTPPPLPHSYPTPTREDRSPQVPSAKARAAADMLGDVSAAPVGVLPMRQVRDGVWEVDASAAVDAHAAARSSVGVARPHAGGGAYSQTDAGDNETGDGVVARGVGAGLVKVAAQLSQPTPQRHDHAQLRRQQRQHEKQALQHEPQHQQLPQRQRTTRKQHTHKQHRRYRTQQRRSGHDDGGAGWGGAKRGLRASTSGGLERGRMDSKGRGHRGRWSRARSSVRPSRQYGTTRTHGSTSGVATALDSRANSHPYAGAAMDGTVVGRSGVNGHGSDGKGGGVRGNSEIRVNADDYDNGEVHDGHDLSSRNDDTNQLQSLSNTRSMKTMQTNLALIDNIAIGEELRIDFTHSWTQGSVIEFAGEYAMIVPPNTAHVGHVFQHIGFSAIPFSLDLVRQEYFWHAQWVADMHLPADPVEIAPNSGFSPFGGGLRHSVMSFDEKSRAVIKKDASLAEARARGKGDVMSDVRTTGQEPEEEEAERAVAGVMTSTNMGGVCRDGVDNAESNQGEQKEKCWKRTSTKEEEREMGKRGEWTGGNHNGHLTRALHAATVMSVTTGLTNMTTEEMMAGEGKVPTEKVDIIIGNAGKSDDSQASPTYPKTTATKTITSLASDTNRHQPYRYYDWYGSPVVYSMNDDSIHAMPQIAKTNRNEQKYHFENADSMSKMTGIKDTTPTVATATNPIAASGVASVAVITTSGVPPVSNGIATASSGIATSRVSIGTDVGVASTPLTALHSSSGPVISTPIASILSSVSPITATATSTPITTAATATDSAPLHGGSTAQRPYISKLEASLPSPKKRHNRRKIRRNHRRQKVHNMGTDAMNPRKTFGKNTTVSQIRKNDRPLEISKDSGKHIIPSEKSWGDLSVIRARSGKYNSDIFVMEYVEKQREDNRKMKIEMENARRKDESGVWSGGDRQRVEDKTLSSDISQRHQVTTLSSATTQRPHAQTLGNNRHSLRSHDYSTKDLPKVRDEANYRERKRALMIREREDVEKERQRRIAARLAKQGKNYSENAYRDNYGDVGDGGVGKDGQNVMNVSYAHSHVSQHGRNGGTGNSNMAKNAQQQVYYTPESKNTNFDARGNTGLSASAGAGVNVGMSRQEDGIYRLFSQYQYRADNPYKIRENTPLGKIYAESPEGSSPESSDSPSLSSGRVSYTPFQSAINPTNPLDDSCLNPFASNIFADFTVRRASVEQDLYSLVNPLGLVHPAYEFHHFAISGVYSATNTFFVEFVVERVS